MTTGHRDEPGTRRRLTIGQVLAELEPEFPGLSPSKLRFLETQGLVTPERTPSGYRVFSLEDVERLRYVLTAQRDRFWPIKVIREALEGIDRDRGAASRSTGAEAGPPPQHPQRAAAELLAAPSAARVTGPELRQASGIDKSMFTALESFGLIRADGKGHFPAEAVDVARAARRLAEHGLEPRHLRPFRAAADREIGLVEQLLATRRNESREERVAEVVAAGVALHVALVRAGLAR